MFMGPSLSVDAVYSILASRDRRIVLATMRDGHVHHVDELAESIVAVTSEPNDGDSFDDAASPSLAVEPPHDSVSVALVHNHLPRLVDHGVVEWDPRSGDVVRGERFDDIVPYLESLYPDAQPSTVAMTGGC